MSHTKTARQLAQDLESGIDYQRIYSDLCVFNKLERYSGSKDGEAAADFIESRLLELGIRTEAEVYSLYRSLPLRGRVEAEGRSFEAMPFVYSASAKDLKAELCFDRYSAGMPCTQKEMSVRCANFEGKIVLTYDESYGFAREAAKAGAVGIITIWHADLLHHGTLGGVWGTPEPEDLFSRYPMLPYAEVTKSDGEWLRDLTLSHTVSVCLDIMMDNSIVNTQMPIARIQGKSDRYVLVSGHYDSWYEGITDNGVANVFMLELARLLKQHQGELERTVVLAWWTGHSDGRYAGSTCYFDRHYADLKENCIAHLNMDICGCKGSDLVGFNTAMLEGRAFNDEVLADFNAEAPIAPIPMIRFADQSFWGADVPFSIMPKYSMRNFDKLPFFFWWHSREDTLDKIDPDVVVRDGRVMARLTALFANSRTLPAHFSEYLNWMEAQLSELESHLTADFNLSSIHTQIHALREAIRPIEASAELPDELVKRIGGTLTRLVYTASSPYHQDPAVDGHLFPGLSVARDCTPSNTTPEYYLAVQTRFLRQRNRLSEGLDELIRFCSRIES